MNKKISFQAFVISQIIIFLAGLVFVSSLYFYLNRPQKSTTNLLSQPVTSAPASLNLELTTPDDDFLAFDSVLSISGKTSPLLPILIYTQTKDMVVTSNKNGTFTADFKLDQGVNEIKIIVFDKNGQERSVERSVYYSKEKI